MSTKDTAKHYDLLIDENNDPVHDPEPLRQYMNKWDGQPFIDELNLSPNKDVLEIGVGTGRLALKTAPLCHQFYGIDISSKTIERAKENLCELKNINLICADFLSYNFRKKFDIIYSSLTFMHIKDKKSAIYKVFDLLKTDGRFVLSVDKNQSKFIEYDNRKIEIYPDNSNEILKFIKLSGLKLLKQFETEFAYIFSAYNE